MYSSYASTMMVWIIHYIHTGVETGLWVFTGGDVTMSSGIL
jgi:hypothetical protein